MTAAEFARLLESDPEYQAMMAEKRRQWTQQAARLEQDETPLVEAIRDAGCCVRSVWELVNSSEPYPQLIEMLANHLTKPYLFRTKEGIARALTVKESRGTRAPTVILDELKKLTDPTTEQESSYRWALINALVLIGNESMTAEVNALLENPKYERDKKDLHRLMRALQRSRRRR
jgi:hypothetical protein